MRVHDLPQLLAIEESTQAIPWNEATFKHCFDVKYPGWVLEEERKIQGFIIISLHDGECHILNLCVAMPSQRQGLGTKLLTDMIRMVKAKGAVIAYLEVRKSNSRAIRLYKNLRFIQIGERKNYYPLPEGREDALIFAKDLGIDYNPSPFKKD